MKRWIIICLFCLLPAASQAYTVSGTLSGHEAFPPALVFAIPTSLDTFYTTLEGLFNDNYTFANLDSGSYFFVAWQDVNLSLSPDLGDPFGFYGGTFPLPVLVVMNYDTIDIELSTPTQGGFSGEISYSGAETGPTFVAAYESPDFSGTPSGVGILLDLEGDSNDGNGPYTALTDTQAVYYAMAYMDLNSNLQYDEGEPMGVYGGDTPESFEVVLTDLPTDINIELIDPESAVDRPHIGSLPEGFSLGVPYPNPFNSETSIPFVLGNEADVELLVYDLLGREAGLIDSGRMAAGEHTVKFNAQGYTSGIYFVELVVNGARSMQRVVLVK